MTVTDILVLKVSRIANVTGLSMDAYYINMTNYNIYSGWKDNMSYQYTGLFESLDEALYDALLQSKHLYSLAGTFENVTLDDLRYNAIPTELDNKEELIYEYVIDGDSGQVTSTTL